VKINFFNIDFNYIEVIIEKFNIFIYYNLIILKKTYDMLKIVSYYVR